MPDDSPELLKPLLEHLSENIGLDDLTLLDLRTLDPPPALGANLMMMIGTARSEKHLHVSADRFCRWLRTNHRLSPYADGLLGRNELKLKMRRKARRIKLLSSVGAVEDGDVDDGIRTGWVCVNVGEIEQGEQDVNEANETSGFIGFGGSNNGARLVVQMMTEEKREELDLERLWGGYVIRQQRKEAREAKKDGETLSQDVGKVGDIMSKTRGLAGTSPLLLSQTHVPSDLPSPILQQRGIHTNVSASDESIKLATRQQRTSEFSSSAGVNYYHDQVESLGQHQTVKETVPPFEPRLNWAQLRQVSTSREPDRPGCETADCIQIPIPTKSSTEEDIKAALSDLVNYLDRLSPDDAREALGKGPHDETSTTFLRIYHQNLKHLQEKQQVRFRMKRPEYKLGRNHPEFYRALLLNKAVTKQQNGYTKDHLMEHLRSLQETSITIGIALYAQYITGLATPDYEIDVTPVASARGHNRTRTQEVVTRKSLYMILEVMEDMQMRGINLAQREILPRLCGVLTRCQTFDQDAAGRMISPDAVERMASPDAAERMISPDAVHRITQIMFRHRLPIMPHSYYEQLLECFANAGNWTAYWQCWRGLARRSQSRTIALYQNLFRHMADTENQKMCLDALREWVSEMERENPPVGLVGNEILVYEITRCLRIADPRSEQMAVESQIFGEWGPLWQRLSGATKEAYDTQKAGFSNQSVEDPGFWNQSYAEDRGEHERDEADRTDNNPGESPEDAQEDFSPSYGLKA